MNLYWLTEQDILSNENGLYSATDNFVSSKRQLFRDRLARYNSINNNSKKEINVNKIMTTINSQLSLYLSDDMTVIYSGIEVDDEELMDNLNIIADYDYKSMWIDRMNYQVQWDRLFFGVWLRLEIWFNKNKVQPIFKTISPMCWRPDPLWDVINGYRFHIFDFETTKNELMTMNLMNKWEPVYYNLDKITKKVDDDQRQTRERVQGTRYLNSSDWDLNMAPSDRRAIDNDETVAIRESYFSMWEYKYRCVTANEWTLLIHFSRLEPQYEEERKNPLDVPYPVVVNAFCPYVNDPFGLCIPDIMEDKEKAISGIINATIKKSKRSAIWWEYVYDVNMIANPSLLGNPSIDWPSYIPVDWLGQSIANAVIPIPKDRVDGNDLNVSTLIDQISQLESGIDNQQLWIQSPWNKTLWQQQLLQLNNNSRNNLFFIVNNWWEQDFAKLYCRALKKNSSEYDKKLVKISNDYWSKSVTFSKIEFLGNRMPDVDIISKLDWNAKNEWRRAFMQAYLPIIKADPTKPEIAKLAFERKLYRLQWRSKDEVYDYVPLTDDEINAKRLVGMINANYPVKEPIKEWADPDTLIYYVRRANDWTLKEEVLNKILEYKGWLKAVNAVPNIANADMTGVANSAWTNMVNRLSQLESKQPSRQDLTA